jgi:lauroyl/myristoyl acyltransferase
VPITAFWRKVCVTFLHSVLVQRGGARLIPLDGIPLRGGRCQLIVNPSLSFPPGASRQEIAQACWNFFEPRIREQPELYMWAYKHFRYRPCDADPGDYPFYANVSSKFEELLDSWNPSNDGPGAYAKYQIG